MASSLTVEEDMESISSATSPRSPHKRHTVYNESPTSEQGWQPSVPIPLLPVHHSQYTIATGGLHMPPQRMARKLIRVVLGYLLCMGLSLMLIRCALVQLPSPGLLAKQVNSPEMMKSWVLPRSFEDLRKMQTTLEAYRADYFPQLMLAFCLIYLFMQCFTVPGCAFFTVLLGSLLPHVPATLLATSLITVGCIVTYQLSKYVLTDLLLYAIPNRVRIFQQAVSQQGSENLFSYMLLLRVVPVVPAWMVNFASPLANVPLGIYTSTVAIGFQPQIFIMISAGRTISQLHSWKDIYHWQSILTLVVCAVFSVLPVLLRRRMARAATAETNGELHSDAYTAVPQM
eukprot:jgi/Ulvmu1/2663/UM014_0119.1